MSVHLHLHSSAHIATARRVKRQCSSFLSCRSLCDEKRREGERADNVLHSMAQSHPLCSRTRRSHCVHSIFHSLPVYSPQLWPLALQLHTVSEKKASQAHARTNNRRVIYIIVADFVISSLPQFQLYICELYSILLTTERVIETFKFSHSPLLTVQSVRLKKHTSQTEREVLSSQVTDTYADTVSHRNNKLHSELTATTYQSIQITSLSELTSKLNQEHKGIQSDKSINDLLDDVLRSMCVSLVSPFLLFHQYCKC